MAGRVHAGLNLLGQRRSFRAAQLGQLAAERFGLSDEGSEARPAPEDFVDLPFQVMQKRPGPFVTMIAPKSYLVDVVDPRLVRYLDAHYPRKENDKFIAWDLRTATAGISF